MIKKARSCLPLFVDLS